MNNSEFDNELGKLIDQWCDRRQLTLLTIILKAYPRFSDLTDSWGELATALKTIRAQHQDLLESGELDAVIELQQIAENLIHK